MELENKPNQEGMTMEIQCRFITGMPERFQIAPT